RTSDGPASSRISSSSSFPRTVKNTFLILFAAVLAAPSLDTTVAKKAVGGGDHQEGPASIVTLGVGVLAAPCEVAEGGIAAQQVLVSPESEVDLLSVFDCEDGEFNVTWSGVVGSVFRRCRAGDVPMAGDNDIGGAGGGVAVEFSDVMIEGSLFDSCYASKKGGGFHQGQGQTSVVDSLFYNSSAGSDNVIAEEEIGEGGAISLTSCPSSFDGLSACGANDTVFWYSTVARKGGAIVIGSGSFSSHIELHRCNIFNSTVGVEIKDGPQGEGGAIAVGQGISLLLADCVLTENYCGKKGGAITTSSGWDSFGVEEGGMEVTLRNSNFTKNWAHLDNSGVVNVGGFATLIVEGNNNVFANNRCGVDGAVFGVTLDSRVVVEGGMFFDNEAGEDGGVIWTIGNLTIRGGLFSRNIAPSLGGVVSASDESTVLLEGGEFLSNEAAQGGVVFVDTGAALEVKGGVFEDNRAGNEGGVFAVFGEGHINITGGKFMGNEAFFGGFLYKEGAGNAFCTGATVTGNSGVNGGAIYAVEGAELEWGCDLVENSAILGPAIYASNDAYVFLRGMKLSGNTANRGSVVFLVSSNCMTDQVIFEDPLGAIGLSAVEVDGNSSYMAEDTSFVGFAGEVLLSEGTLHLDNCDFSGSPASVLVSVGDSATTVVRNAVLGDTNYADIAKAASRASELPRANSFANVNLTCDGVLPPSSSPLCSEGSSCLDGDLGVYCHCYKRESTGEDRCMSGGPELLTLTATSTPKVTFFPDMLEGDLLLSLASVSSTTVTTTTTSGGNSSSSSKSVGITASGGDGSSSSSSSSGVSTAGTEGGVVWNVSGLVLSSSAEQEGVMEWTVFPSAGLLLPGTRYDFVPVSLVAIPSESFDGTASVSFKVDSMAPTLAAAAIGDSIEAQTTGQGEDEEDGGGGTVSFNVSFYHCDVGSFWNTGVGSSSCAEHADTCCELCTDIAEGNADGLDCSFPGATTQTLPIKPGYWRASLETLVIRECLNEDACLGGTRVASEEEYCNAGYKGPQCAVCSSDYGRGAASACHRCTASFKGGMYFVFAVATMVTIVIAALLAVYLVGGKGAVSTTVTNTRQSVKMLHTRGSGLLLRTNMGGRLDSTGVSTGIRGSKASGSVAKGDGDRVVRIGSGDGGDFTVKGSGVGRPFVGAGDKRKNSSVIVPLVTSGVSTDSTTASNAVVAAASVSATSGNTIRGAGGGNGGQGAVVAGEVDAAPAAFTSAAAAANAHSAATEAAAAREKSDTNIISSAPPPLPGPADSFNHHDQQHRRRQAEVADEADASVVKERSSSGRTVPPAFAATLRSPGFAGGVNGGGDVDTKNKKTKATRIGEALAWLPLSKLKIVVVVWQISIAFAEITQVPFPPVFEKFLAVIGIFSFDLGWILSAACLSLGIGFYDKLLMVTIGPLGLLLLLGITFYVGARPVRKGHLYLGSSRAVTATALPRRRGPAPPTVSTGSTSGDSAIKLSLLPPAAPSVQRHQQEEDGSEERRTRPRPSARRVWQNGPGDASDPEQNHLWQLFARHTTMTLIILYLVYTQVSTVVFQAFACENFPEIGKRYLRADFRIDCDTPKHESYKIYAAVMICVYPLGIPAAFCYFLVRQRSRINPPTDTMFGDLKGRNHIVEEKLNIRGRDQAIAPTSFLWNAYYPNRYYYEVLECFRRFLLTGLLVFLVPDTPGQVAFGCVFAFLSLLVFERLRPHTDPLDMELYRTGCLVIFFTNFLALMIKAEVASENSSGCAVYSVALIVVNVLFFLSVFWNAWATTKASFSRSHVQGMMLGVDLVDEDQVDKVLEPMKASKTSQQKLDEALEPATGSMRGTGEVKIEDLEAPPAWEVDHNVLLEAPIDTSTRF
ncbi:unnamed protein product, partial [Pylaiella littoralis]